MLVINIFGGPGVGKSFLARDLTNVLGADGVSVEYVTEAAKDLTYAGHTNELANQMYVSALQNQRIEVLKGQVEVAVVDSPLLTGLAYSQYKGRTRETFEDFMVSLHNDNQNFNIFLGRGVEYRTYGRSQSEEEAIEIDGILRMMLQKYNIKFIEVEEFTPAHMIAGDIHKLLETWL